MKVKLLSALLLGAFFLSACTEKEGGNTGGDDTPILPIENPNQIDLPNHNFEEGLEGWTVYRNSNATKTLIEVVEGQGVKNSKCLKVQQLPENGKCCAGVSRQLTGLEPDQMYRLSVRVRYSDIPNGEGTGPVIFSPNSKQYWNSSKYLYGTELEKWTTVVVDFLADDNGNATIVVALGYWQGGMANGGRSTGTAYFDNLTLLKVTSELFMMESDHMRFFFEPSKVTISSTLIKTWIDNIDPMYEAMVDLMGAAPHEGRKLAIQTTRGIYSGYWALAGYPILWSINYDAVEKTLSQVKDYNDMSFGLMHEIGHVFNMGNTSWNWNDEMFANFRMHYALRQTGLIAYQTDENGESKAYVGGDIINLYRVSYEKTINTKVNDNGIHYMLARLAEDIGWDTYKKTFNHLRQYGYSGSSNKYDKFVNFVNTLTKFYNETHGTNVDLMNKFSSAEITSIKKQLQ